MTDVQKIYAAWGAVATAIIVALAAFPSIAGTAVAQRDAAQWETRAQSLAETPAAVDASTPSSMTLERLASLQEIDTQYGQDLHVTADLMSYHQIDFEASKVQMAEELCLAEAIYYEARSETRSGQKAVAEVILNRVASKHFPSTICGVVYEGSERRTGCQFSFTCDGSMDIAPKGKSWQRSKDMAGLMITGAETPMTNRATHYHTSAITPKWSKNMRMTRRVGSHVFYRFAPRDYTPSTPALTVAPPI
jgi:spore germination cell wall hydrolase CwlJ-like protein